MAIEQRRRPETPRAVLDARRLISDPDAAAAASESQRRLGWLVAASAMGSTPRQRRQGPDAIGGGVTFEEAQDFRLTDAVIGSGDAPRGEQYTFSLKAIGYVFAVALIAIPLLWLMPNRIVGAPAQCVIAPTSCQTFEDSLSRNARL